MSKNTIRTITSDSLVVDTDLSKIFIWRNEYINAELAYNNVGSTDVLIPAGTLMGRIASGQKITPLASGASDGSQFPIGILAQDVYVAYGEDFDSEVAICVAGDVAQEMIGLQGSDTLTTLISNRSIQDRIGSDTVGIKIVPCDNFTNYDN